MQKIGLYLYYLFIISWFLHISSRLPILGSIRFDLILILGVFICITLKKSKEQTYVSGNNSSKILKIICIYIILTIPFVEWPGSVLNTGIPNFIKAIVFYYFTVNLITSESKIKLFVNIFILCQTFRILEPVYLHLTQGYWGSVASMAGWEAMDRLAGSPDDIINPNGLAFIIVSIIPFLYYLSFTSRKLFYMSLIVSPVAIYALILTGSRSGFVALIVIISCIIIKSKKRFVLSIVSIIILILLFIIMPPNFKDRYLSIVDDNTRNAATAQGRINGIIDDLKLSMRKPFVGHGVGTSREVSANFGNSDQPAHNLYAELMHEVGLIGTIMYVFYIIAILKNFNNLSKKKKDIGYGNSYLFSLCDSMQVWLAMNIIFSFASYGFSSYEWYLFGGLSVVLNNLVIHNSLVTQYDSKGLITAVAN
jgi:putative inorganic carbon (hco3(-)) transporter